MKPTTPFPVRPVPRHPKVWWSRLKWRWPLLIWLCLAGFAVWLYQRGGTALEAQLCEGMVEPLVLSCAPENARTIVELPVREGQRVAPGDLLVRFAATDLETEIAGITARLEAQREARRLRAEESWQRVQRERRDWTLAEAADRAELAALQTELQRRESQLARGLVTDQDLLGLRVDVAAREARLARYPELIAAANAEAARWEEARTNTGTPAEDVALENQIAALKSAREALSLRATEPGVISARMRQPGETVRAGEPVVQWVPDRTSRRVIAFLHESYNRTLEVGQRLTVTKATDDTTSFMATVEAVAPEIMSVPDRASPLPNRMVRGQRVYLRPDADAPKLSPGAGIMIELP